MKTCSQIKILLNPTPLKSFGEFREDHTKYEKNQIFCVVLSKYCAVSPNDVIFLQ